MPRKRFLPLPTQPTDLMEALRTSLEKTAPPPELVVGSITFGPTLEAHDEASGHRSNFGHTYVLDEQLVGHSVSVPQDAFNPSGRQRVYRPATAEESAAIHSTVGVRPLYWPSRCRFCGHDRFALRSTFHVTAGQRYIPGQAPIGDERHDFLVCCACGAENAPNGVVS